MVPGLVVRVRMDRIGGCSNRERQLAILFFFSSRRRHTRLQGDWSSDVCSSDLYGEGGLLDMSAFFERQRGIIFSATLALAVMGGLATYADRNNVPGWKPNEWIDRKSVV